MAIRFQMGYSVPSLNQVNVYTNMNALPPMMTKLKSYEKWSSYFNIYSNFLLIIYCNISLAQSFSSNVLVELYLSPLLSLCRKLTKVFRKKYNKCTFFMENRYFFKFWCFDVQLSSLVFSNLSFLSASIPFVYNAHVVNKNHSRSWCNAWPHFEIIIFVLRAPLWYMCTWMARSVFLMEDVKWDKD